MDMSALLSKMTIFVVLMVIGYVCARVGATGPEFTKGASKLVINVFMTATILNSVMTGGISLSGRELGVTMLVLTISIAMGYVVGAIACRVMRFDRDHEPLFELQIAVVNNMFIALPVVEQLFGAQAVFYCSLSCLPFNVLLYTYGTARLKGSIGGERVRIKDVFSIPLVATLTALVIFLVQPPIPSVVKDLASSMSGATMPLSMIVIGSSLGTVSLLDSFKDGKMYIMSALRLLLVPLLVWLLCGLVTDDFMLRTTATIIAASPSAVVITVLTIQYDRDYIFTSQGILLSTVLSMLTIPVVVYLVHLV